MPDRVPCCVPFCRRIRKTREDEAVPSAEYICGKHWRRIPLHERKVYYRAYADASPAWYAEWKKPPRWLVRRRVRAQQDRGYPLTYLRADRLWSRMKRRAVECADLGTFA